jgi:hypothetical protein
MVQQIPMAVRDDLGKVWRGEDPLEAALIDDAAVPIVGDGRGPLTPLFFMASLESCANPTAGGL